MRKKRSVNIRTCRIFYYDSFTVFSCSGEDWRDYSRMLPVSVFTSRILRRRELSFLQTGPSSGFFIFIFTHLLALSLGFPDGLMARRSALPRHTGYFRQVLSVTILIINLTQQNVNIIQE